MDISDNHPRHYWLMEFWVTPRSGFATSEFARNTVIFAVAAGCLLVPGLIDSHATVQEPMDKEGQYRLCQDYSSWEGGSRDVVSAAKWCRRAAEQGHVFAQYELALMFLGGDGVPQNHTEAVEWFRKAAEQGFAPAQRELGTRYRHGQGVARDYEAMVMWYRKAAENGDEPAQYFLGDLYFEGELVERNYTEAAKWFWKAADQGDIHSQFLLLLMYARGQGVEKDLTEASKWYRRAAKRGLFARHENSGLLWSGTRKVSVKDPRTMEQFRVVAETCDSRAQFYLGLGYHLGVGAKQDEVKAYAWYSLSEGPLAESMKASLVQEMTADQIAAGERIVGEWKKAHSQCD